MMKRHGPSTATIGLGGGEPGPPLKTRKTEHQASKKALTDVQGCLEYLQSLIPHGVFHSHPPLPPIVMKHQLYSLLQDRTLIDREIISLRDTRCIRLFKLGVSEQDYAIVSEDSYMAYLQAIFQEQSHHHHHQLVQRVLAACREVSVTRTQLTGECGVRQEQVSALVRHGVLVVRDVGKANGSWWFSIPGVSPFTKSLVKGRTLIQQTLRRSKFKELLESELRTRKLSASKLSMEYHIHDLIGSDLVESISTTSGPLLRLVS